MNCNACLNSPGTSRTRQGGYMTPDEFKRYFAARRRVLGHTEAAPNQESEHQVVKHEGGRASGAALSPAPKHERSKAGALSVTPAVGTRLTEISGQLGRAGRLVAAIEKKLGEKDIINKTIRLADEWIAVDPKEYRAEGARKKIPYQLMLMILALSVSLLLIVSGSVISSKAEMELRTAKNRLVELCEYKEELEQKLEIKNDLRYIEAVARTKLGMIDKNYAPLKYLGDEPEEKVVIYDTGAGDGRIGLSTLLSALGFPD